VGSRLVESRLAAMLGVSRGPVREALYHLEQQGLVRRHPYRGSYVASFAPQELAEVFILRAELESLAARLAVVRGAVNQSNIATLEHLVEKIDRAARSGDWSSLLDLDMEFHRLVAEWSGHQRLIAILDGLRTHTRIAIALANRNVEAIHGIVETHRAVLEALASGDLPRVDRETKRHVLETLDYLGLQTDGLAEDCRAVMLDRSTAAGPRRRRGTRGGRARRPR
jgi:DNA-binding GntR family transcriptional regulator